MGGIAESLLAEMQRKTPSKAYLEAAAPLLRDLRKAGYDLKWLGQLRLTHKHYAAAIPIVLRWLPRVQDLDLKEDIVRTLTVKAARPQAARPLIEAFEAAPDSEEHGLKWAIANALSVVADDTVLDDMVRLARDKRHGRAREMLTDALGNMKSPQAQDVLIELLSDEQVAAHAIRPLGKRRAVKARRRLEDFLNHPKAWVRKEARRALEKIDRPTKERRNSKPDVSG